MGREAVKKNAPWMHGRVVMQWGRTNPEYANGPSRTGGERDMHGWKDVYHPPVALRHSSHRDGPPRTGQNGRLHRSHVRASAKHCAQQKIP